MTNRYLLDSRARFQSILSTLRCIRFSKWAGHQLKNGELLKLAAAEGFVALLSADKNMEYQQSPKELAVAVIVLTSIMNRFVDLVPLVPSVIALLEDDLAPDFYRIEK